MRPLLLIFMGWYFISCQSQQQLISNTQKIQSSEEYSYYLYFPKNYKDTGQPTALLLFLHGGGEAGRNLEDVKKHGPPKMMADGYDFPFLVLAPQNPYERRFWNVHHLRNLVLEIVKRYNVDKNRLYLTGLSRGGSAAWEMVVQYPDMFAAMAVVCGVTPDNYSHWINPAMPIWVFHGSDDPIIPVTESDIMVQKLKEKGHSIKYTRYEGVGHNSWEQAYQTPGLFEWLAQQKRINDE